MTASESRAKPRAAPKAIPQGASPPPTQKLNRPDHRPCKPKANEKIGAVCNRSGAAPRKRHRRLHAAISKPPRPSSKSTKGDMGRNERTSSRRNHDDLEGPPSARGDRNYYEFSVKAGQERAGAFGPPFQINLNKTDPKKIQSTLWTLRRGTIGRSKRRQGLSRRNPCSFLRPEARRQHGRMKIVVFNRWQGTRSPAYLSTPQGRFRFRRAAWQRPAACANQGRSQEIRRALGIREADSLRLIHRMYFTKECLSPLPCGRLLFFCFSFFPLFFFRTKNHKLPRFAFRSQPASTSASSPPIAAANSSKASKKSDFHVFDKRASSNPSRDSSPNDDPAQVPPHARMWPPP